MAARADELHDLGDGVLAWQTHDPTVKTDVGSTALSLPGGRLLLVDPVGLTAGALRELTDRGTPARVILTNGNHARAAARYRQAFGIPVAAHPDAVPELDTRVDHTLDGRTDPDSLAIIPLPGGPPGEVAVWQATTGTLVLGDALIHLPDYGFTFLPDKYAPGPALMRRSLTALAPLNPRRITFAHGDPILTDAAGRLAELVGTR